MASQVDEVVLSHDIDGKPTDFCVQIAVSICAMGALRRLLWRHGSKGQNMSKQSGDLPHWHLTDWYQVDIRLDLLDLLNLRYLRLQWQVPTGNTGTMRSSPTVPRGAATWEQKTARKGSDTSRWWGTQKDSRNKRPKQNEKNDKKSTTWKRNQKIFEARGDKRSWLYYVDMLYLSHFLLSLTFLHASLTCFMEHMTCSGNVPPQGRFAGEGSLQCGFLENFKKLQKLSNWCHWHHKSITHQSPCYPYELSIYIHIVIAVFWAPGSFLRSHIWVSGNGPPTRRSTSKHIETHRRTSKTGKWVCGVKISKIFQTVPICVGVPMDVQTIWDWHGELLWGATSSAQACSRSFLRVAQRSFCLTKRKYHIFIYVLLIILSYHFMISFYDIILCSNDWQIEVGSASRVDDVVLHRDIDGRRPRW